MDSVVQLQSVLIGMIGWAATAAITMGVTRFTPNDQRMMLVCSWMLWMIPAFGALVYRGMITADTAAIYCAGTTLLVGIVVLITAVRPRTRP